MVLEEEVESALGAGLLSWLFFGMTLLVLASG